MAKLLYAIETSFEKETVGGLSDIAAAIAFLAVIIAGVSWLMI